MPRVAMLWLSGDGMGGGSFVLTTNEDNCLSWVVRTVGPHYDRHVSLSRCSVFTSLSSSP